MYDFCCTIFGPSQTGEQLYEDLTKILVERTTKRKHEIVIIVYYSIKKYKNT